jgi:hypothetical protein
MYFILEFVHGITSHEYYERKKIKKGRSSWLSSMPARDWGVGGTRQKNEARSERE